MMEPFKLERYFAKYEFKAKYMASSSDAEAMTLSDLLKFDDAIREELPSVWLGYSEATGLPELRAEISKTYTTISPEQVLTHLGAEEPILNFYQSCFSPSDHVIVHSPCYQSFYSIPRAIGCEVSHWKTHFESAWSLDIDALAQMIQPNTRAVMINSPHNPTGFHITAQDQEKMIQLLRSKGILLFSDEVYREIELDPRDRLPAACDLYENAISLGVLSKAYGLPGLRLGWIATRNQEVLAKMTAQKDYTTICNPVLSEKLGIIAVRNREAIIARNRTIVLTNWALCQGFFKRHADKFEVITPRGGTMIFPRAKPGFNLQKFMATLLDQKGVMIVGGEHFDMPTEYFRLGLGRKNFPEVLTLMEEHLASL